MLTLKELMVVLVAIMLFALIGVGVSPHMLPATVEAHPHPPTSHGPGGDPNHTQAFIENQELIMIDGDVGGEEVQQALVDIHYELDHRGINTIERVALIEESIGDGIATSEQLQDLADLVTTLTGQVEALEALHP